MEIRHLSDMSKNWFVGDFEPHLFRGSDYLEMSLQRFYPGQFEGIYQDSEKRIGYLIIEGSAKANGILCNQDDAVIYDPGDTIVFFPYTYCVVLMIYEGRNPKKQRFTREGWPYEKMLALFQEAFALRRESETEQIPTAEEIRSEDISVVIQGAVDPELAPLCIESVRSFLPGAEVVVSTWEGAEAAYLDYDKVVFNEDPGGKNGNNTNRQLVSTQGGLKKASRKYALKIRSDAMLCGKDFLKHFDIFNQYDSEYKVLKSRILVPELLSRKEITYEDRDSAKLKTIATPFHVSDWFLFGYTEDMIEYFDASPLLAYERLGDYHWCHEERVKGYPVAWAFPGEQYYGYSLYHKYFQKVTMMDLSDYNEDTIYESEKFLSNNFLPLPSTHFEIILLKKPYIREPFCNCGNNYWIPGLWRYTDFRDYWMKNNKGTEREKK